MRARRACDPPNMTRIEMTIVVLLLAAWIPGLLAMAEVWNTVEYASHGYLVPWVALWAATAHREALSRLPSQPPRLGLLLIGALVLGYVAALAFDDASVIGALFVATAVGVVFALRGPHFVRVLQFPLAYLIFMIPLPVSWVTPLIVKLQLIVSTAAVRLLQFAGVSIFREGNVLTLPGDQSLFVAEACSGITSLITLIPIGVFIAYFTESVAWRRGVIVVAVIPIALAGNLLRVLLTVELAIEVDVEFATTGPLHEWAGVGTYVLGCVFLLGVGSLLRRFFPDESVARPSERAEA